MRAAGPQYSVDQLNFFKFEPIVRDQFTEVLRQVFKTMWDKKFPSQPWDDSVAIRNQLSAQEVHNRKKYLIPTDRSYEEWDCTAFATATIFAKTFEDGAGRTLSDQYLTRPPGKFRFKVTSLTGNQDETFALAIDQLRRLRNEFCHAPNTEVIDTTTFHYYIFHAKIAFEALQFDTSYIDYIRKLPESEFPTDNVSELKKRVEEKQSDKKRFYYIVGLLLLILFFVARDDVQSLLKPVSSVVPRGMNAPNPMFIGRRWLFNHLDNLFEENNDISGVLLVGDPGSGKTAIMRQLVNSPDNSSRFIHENIIAYHFCKYDERTTRDGETFVKSLVEQLSGKVTEFTESIQTPEIQNKLDKCKDDPIRCVKMAVIEPLNALMPSKTRKVILIDALGECRGNEGSYKSVIIEILHGQMTRLPSWIKLLMSSRNDTTITGKMSEIGVQIIPIRATSKNNLDDIRSFAQEMISLHDYRKKNGKSMKKKLNEFIGNILNRADGNFLFIQKLLEDWAKDPDKINLTSIPSDMKYVYARSFRERFQKNELKRFATIFEVLLASNSPPTLGLLKRILTLTGLMDDYELHEVKDKLSAFLRFNNRTVRIYHQSFAEWLTNQNTTIDGFSIEKSRGHQYIADYFFEHYNQTENELTVEGLYELSLHVLHGGMLRKHVKKLQYLNSEVFDQFGRRILHYLALNKKSTGVLHFFIQKFKSVEIFDQNSLTPAYNATIAGNYRNLKLLIENGADVNYVARVRNYCGISSIISLSSIIYEYCSLTFIAANKGYTKIVELLINSGADFEKQDECGWKPLYGAIKGGHLKIVEFLLNKNVGTSSNVFALHQAAVFNHSDVLTFLLESGVRDKCIPCKRDHKDYSKLNLSIDQYLETICGSVLNIAVARRNLKIVKILLSYGKETLECKSFAGLTPLMHAVERNDIRMASLLLDEGADSEAQCESRSKSDVDIIKRIHVAVFLPTFFPTYYCVCTSKAIHISVIKGTSRITTELLKRKANRFSRDCMGWSADELAAMHNQYINPSLRPVSNKTLIRYLAVCGSVKTLEALSENKSSVGVLTSVDEDGMTLLHLATLGLTNLFYPVCAMINCTAFKCPHMDALQKHNREKQYLRTIKLLTKASPRIINKKDKHGRTALHYAALVKSPDAVKHLIQQGSDWRIKDENGNTALEFVLKRPIDSINLGPCSTVIYSLFNSSKMIISDETHVNCLIMLTNLSTKCNGQRISLIVQHMILHSLTPSWYTLLKVYTDLICISHKYFGRYFPTALMSQSAATISELLKVFKPDVEVNCEVPFDYSYLHIMAFYWYYDFSSLQRFVESHPNGSRILNERYDLEGYLPFHRAILGGFPDTIDWFMNQGVDIWQKTKSGWTAFDLSLTDRQCSPYILDKLLNDITSNRAYKVPSGSDFWLNSTSAHLSLLHIATINDLKCLHYIQNNTFIPIPRVPFTSCNNTHGIDLLYLMKLYHDAHQTTEWKDLGFPINTAQYPEREAEYHLVYNDFFVTPHVNLNLKLEVNVLDLFRRPGISGILPHGHVIEGQIRRCYNRCWHSASHANRSFLSTFRTVCITSDMFDPRSDRFIDILPQMAELRYYCVQMFYKVNTVLWRQVSKAYSCSLKCRSLEIKRLLQKAFTSKPRIKRVGSFVAERMGWNDTSLRGDILFRWPFDFLLRKALKMDKDYEYLKILSPYLGAYE